MIIAPPMSLNRSALSATTTAMMHKINRMDILGIHFSIFDTYAAAYELTKIPSKTGMKTSCKMLCKSSKASTSTV